MRSLLTAVLIFACSPVMAGEESTTWRAGDEVSIGFVCNDPDMAMAAAEQNMRQAMRGDRLDGCLAFPTLARVTLVEWVSGPHMEPIIKAPVSVWRVRSELSGKQSFTWWPDGYGPHKRAVGL